MRKLVFFVIILGLLAGLTACDTWVKDDYLSMSPHVEQSVPPTEPTEEELPPVVTGRNELRGTILSFIRNWTEHGVILVKNYDGDISADLTETLHYIKNEDPIGAYAVDFADAELEGDGRQGSIQVNLVFRRSAAEIDSIVTVSGNNGAYSKIQKVLAAYDTALTLRVRNYQETDFSAYIWDYCVKHPDQVLVIPEISAEVYPQEGETRILELHFSYPGNREDMRAMQNSLSTILSSASAYIRSGQDEAEKASLLYRFLCTRFDYAVEEEEPTAPAYQLLCNGVAHSLSFASVFYAECSTANLNCQMVTGTRNRQTYYWNLLRVGEQYYYVDLMRSITNGETEIHLLTSEELLEEGYFWDLSAYPATPAYTVTEPSEGEETATEVVEIVTEETVS